MIFFPPVEKFFPQRVAMEFCENYKLFRVPEVVIDDREKVVMVQLLLLLQSLFHLFEEAFRYFWHLDTFHDNLVTIGLYLEDSFIVGKGTHHFTVLNKNLEILFVHFVC